MDVFISWSGERSKAVAELLSQWLKCVVQASKPWVSTHDVPAGSIWFNKISDRLNACSIGVVCLTAENKDAPWILFEAGALAKGLSDARVCTFLIDLEHSDIQPPLSQFNHSRPDKAGLLGLVQSVNSQLGERALESQVLIDVFENYWPMFDHKFKEARKKTESGEPQKPRSQQSILVEILQGVRSMENRISTVEGAIKVFETNSVSMNSFSETEIQDIKPIPTHQSFHPNRNWIKESIVRTHNINPNSHKNKKD